MSAPAASPLPQPEEHLPRSGLRGIPGIMAFAVVAAILLVGPRIWTVGEALEHLWRAQESEQIASARPESGVVAGRRSSSQPSGTGLRRPSASRPSVRPAETGPSARSEAAQVPGTAAPDSPTSAAPGATTKRSQRRVPAPPPPSLARLPAEARIRHFYGLMDQGIQLYRAGWFGPALGRFRQAAAVMPSSPYAHLWLGRASLMAHRTDEAREALERVIALAPGSELARQAQGLLARLD